MVASAKRGVAAIRAMNFKVGLGRKADGRWVAEVQNLPGVLTYGKDRDDAPPNKYVKAAGVSSSR